MKRIVVAGGTGFIGRHVIQALSARGDQVVVLSRRPEQVAERLGRSVRGVYWEPRAQKNHHERPEWFAEASGADALVHLAGEQAVGARYTEETKRRIHDSRVESTFEIVEGIAEADPRPRVFVCASAVGYYGGHSTDQSFDEASPAGEDFLASVVRDWEAAAGRARDYGVRVVSARFGIVLGAGGGALEQMAKPFKMFAGGPVGTGQQVVSWVHVDDVARAILFAIDDERVEGPVNVTSPNAVTNEELSRQIGEVLHRPSWMRVPAAALKLALGEGAEPILTGQRALPRVLEKLGFDFRYRELRPALEQALTAS